MESIEDTTSVVEVSVMAYYTPAFKNNVSDPICHVKRQIAFANVIFAENEIPVRLRAFCIEELQGFHEAGKVGDGGRLNRFRHAKTNAIKESLKFQEMTEEEILNLSEKALLNTADIAILMTSSPWRGRDLMGEKRNALGESYFAPFKSGSPPLAWACAKSPLAFVHEIGHLFGCNHNREEFVRYGCQYYSNYGYLLEGSTMKTIMAAGNSEEDYHTIPYFSSRVFQYKGIQLGDQDNDNRNQIIQTRFLMSQLGDESGNCRYHDKYCKNECVPSCCKVLPSEDENIMRSLIFGKDDKGNFFNTDLLYLYYGVFISSISSEDLEGSRFEFARLVGVGTTWPDCLAVRSKKMQKSIKSALPNIMKRSESNIEEPIANESTQSYPSGMSPFELLPPEILEIIIRMSMRNTKTLKLRKVNPDDLRSKFTTVSKGHNLLSDTIANISVRFRTLASSKSLWKGEVYISGCEKKIKSVMKGFMYDGIIVLHLINTAQQTKTIVPRSLTSRPKRSKTVIQRTTISATDILNMAGRCPNLETLTISAAKLDAWPTFPAPWSSMKILNLIDMEMGCNLFHGIRLHHSLPNLVLFHLGIANVGITTLLDTITLPEMGQCNDLKVVRLNSGDFHRKNLPQRIKIF